MSHEAVWSIGELAERAGATVKTVRFYSDRGLLPEASRSGGGHRRYGPEALERLRLIRSLRALDLPLPEVRRVVEDEDAAGRVLEDAVAGRLRELGGELRALRWREAALRLVRECPPAQRAERLRLLGAVSTPPSTAPLVRFWRAWLPPRTPARAAAAFLEVAVPQPPDEPDPAQVLAFAHLHALTTAPCPPGRQPQPDVHRVAGAGGAALLYAGLAEAYELAGPHLRRGREPYAGEALDAYVAAYASAYGGRDTRDFRRVLAERLGAQPRLDRYWELAAVVWTPPGGPPEPTPGSADDWLRAALERDNARAA
ncbi:MerR family transcriptional regulator [Streptomyces sp. WAC05374]|uniref:helix-turn-helix domain-containing protein n=1 Tax=Streptomyces sp. WAC05374 TaxID=2487420 RepID=UPI000F8669D2|nr:MerR family transcriptional regulator [Streptomyces sp. WAC05374]RST19082.1 MerR family transcriptional regulator [Streptomyces sp. WAC05374]TDF36950.1 MerR family transcriptional regulator [Streptomyces sp. WAC05374]TDF46445.1 MerR family transcriptional regulator [Streptomyces sp. WAC05374]TDF47546.1 MerR family transcriptional regulator [Streptomyces sp. WAC05374]